VASLRARRIRVATRVNELICAATSTAQRNGSPLRWLFGGAIRNGAEGADRRMDLLTLVFFLGLTTSDAPTGACWGTNLLAIITRNAIGRWGRASSVGQNSHRNGIVR